MQPLSIRPAGPADQRWFSSLVLDFEEESALIIGIPMDRGSEVKFEAGTAVQIEVPLADGLRRFSATVRGPGTEPPPSLRLSWPEGVERIQRRDNVRIPVSFRAEVTVLRPDGRLGERMTGLALDLSAGGTRVAVPLDIPAGTELQIVLHLSEYGPQTTDARVVRRGELHHASGENQFWIALEFVRITAPVQRDVTRYVFDVQRELMRRGLA